MKTPKWIRNLWKKDHKVIENEVLRLLLDPTGEPRQLLARIVRGVAKDVAQDALEPAVDRALSAFDSYAKQHSEAVSRETPLHECAHGMTCPGPTDADYQDQEPNK